MLLHAVVQPFWVFLPRSCSSYKFPLLVLYHHLLWSPPVSLHSESSEVVQKALHTLILLPLVKIDSPTTSHNIAPFDSSISFIRATSSANLICLLRKGIGFSRSPSSGGSRRRKSCACVTVVRPGHRLLSLIWSKFYIGLYIQKFLKRYTKAGFGFIVRDVDTISQSLVFV